MNEAEKIKWLDKGAEQGNVFAQFSLGVAYAKGRGKDQDFVAAYKWLDLAAAGGYDEAPELRDALAKKMPPSDVAKAQRMAQKWMVAKEEWERKAK